MTTDTLATIDLPLHLLRVRRLRAHELDAAMHLRRQIDLAAAMAADPHFLAREKKETR